MKIISKNPFRDTKLSGYQGYFKKASVVVLAIAIFLVVYSLLLSFTSPNHYAAAHIGETEAVVESAGGTYIGAVADAYYEGEGEFRHLDGSVYEGSFSKSQRSGQGTFRFANGDVYTGSWANDEMVEGTYTFADGRTYQGKFEDGRFTSGVFSLGSQAAALGFREFSADVALSAEFHAAGRHALQRGAVRLGRDKIRRRQHICRQRAAGRAQRSGDILLAFRRWRGNRLL